MFRLLILLLMVLLLNGGSLFCLEVSPNAIALRHEPGKKLKGEFFLTNDISDPLTIEVKLSPLFGFDSKSVFLKNEKIKVSPQKLQLKPGQKKKVKFSYKSKKPINQEKAFKISFQSKRSESSWLYVSLSNVIYIVPQEMDPSLALNFSYRDEKKNNDLILSADVENTGRVHLLSSAVFFLQEKEGKVLYQHQDPERAVIYPGEKKRYILHIDPKTNRDSLEAAVEIFCRPPFGEFFKKTQTVELNLMGGKP